MYLTDIMTRDVQVIRPDATLREAARRMREFDLQSLPVSDGQRLLGMITDRDIVVRTIAEGCDPNRTRVGEACTERVVFCFEDDDLRDVARTLQLHQIRKMPVLNRHHQLIGTISLADIAREVGEPFVTELLLADGIAQPWHFSELGGQFGNVGNFGGRQIGNFGLRRNFGFENNMAPWSMTPWSTTPWSNTPWSNTPWSPRFDNRFGGGVGRRGLGLYGQGRFLDQGFGTSPFVDTLNDGFRGQVSNRFATTPWRDNSYFSAPLYR